MTFCGLLLDLVESQFLDESPQQIWTEACLTRSPTEVCEQLPRLLDFWPLFQTPKHPLGVGLLSVICDPVPDAKVDVVSEACGSVKEFCGAGTRSCASTRPALWQRGGQRNQRRKRAITCAEVRIWWFLDDDTIACIKPPFESSSSLYRSARFPQVEDVKIDGSLVAYANVCSFQGVHHLGGFTASCCRDGLAVIQPLWAQQTAQESSSRGSVHPHSAGDTRARRSFWRGKKEDVHHRFCHFSHDIRS